MGMEIEVNSLEDMCDLMCYNKLPQEGDGCMTEKELEKIREYIIDNVMTDTDIMLSDARIDGVDLPEIIASLYELLHRQVTGEPYQYFYHFANKIGADVEDNLFSQE
jgi:hypothetical protein